ncbi:MAG: hypothetical protein A3F72_13685 [Bacteroidetes bacterium RIFCSPLOWO2_12_FULL_35_15]|nr:MAG: hypothetical protein A3F72_13685 [Bacteroidetes bacterium RIFCSPLOWO2_12_FULL_35_15]
MRLFESFLEKFFLVLLLVNTPAAIGQNIADGIKYQTIIRNTYGLPINNQLVSLKIKILSVSANGDLQWEEIHNLTTDQNGHVKLVIGAGISTGNGLCLSFSTIHWDLDNYYFNIAVDINGGTNFVDVGSAQLLSVPYSFYSINTDVLTTSFLNSYSDVSVSTGALGKLIEWNGSFWISENDNNSDTALYSFYSFHSPNSDTALFQFSNAAINSVPHANLSDTAQFSDSVIYSENAFSAAYSDTAIFALSCAPIAWGIDGNTNPPSNIIGTIDNQDFQIKTNNSEILRINASGNILITGASDSATLSLMGNEGIIAKGTFASGVLSSTGSGTKCLWFPGKASFRAGGVSSNQWDDSNIGTYSFATGYNCIAGNKSFAAGNSCVASGDYTIAMGRKAQATAVGVYPSGVSISLGDSSTASTPRSLVIGKGNVASTNNAAYAVGYCNLSTGAIGTSLGTHSTASGNWSTVIGYYGSTNFKNGSFVYADASASSITNSTIANQFLVRASGGVIFYSDSLNTMGVILPAGGGSWANVSDKNKKENFQKVDGDKLLSGIENLMITSWNYKTQSPEIHHVGPMSQDFYRIFHVGENKKTISTSDMDGITLLGIKTLNQRMKLLSELDNVFLLDQKINELDNFTELNLRLDQLENKKSK